MGCTSSAPNMVNSSAAEKNIQFEEEMSDAQSKDTEEIIYRAEKNTNETELPTCDNLAEHSIQVVRNRSTPSLKTEKDIQEHENFEELINKSDSSDTLHAEEKAPKLKEVVERVVELNSLENAEVQLGLTTEGSQKSEEGNDNKNRESNIVEKIVEHPQVEEDKKKVDHPEEAISPSQSESSRATRWEALADIAAELPPTLTVDPITGQIYAVSK